MRRVMSWLALTAAFVAASRLGWWAIPAAAVLWGALKPAVRHPAARAAWCAMAAWSLWLVADRLIGGAAMQALGHRLAGVTGMPASALVVITLAFGGILAWSGAVVGGALRGAGRVPTSP